MATVEYLVEHRDGTWSVALNGKTFGPYSTLDSAVTAATGAARKAEAQGYEAIVRIDAPTETAGAGS